MKFAGKLAIVFSLVASQAGAEENYPFRSPMDQVNYGIGVEVIRNYKSQGIEIDLDMVIKGMKDGLSGKTLIPEKELRRMMTTFQTELRRKTANSRRNTVNNAKEDKETLAEDSTGQREAPLQK